VYTNDYINTTGEAMTETLKTLTGLNNTALGYPPQWVENLRMKIGGDAPFEMGDVVGDKKNFGSV